MYRALFFCVAAFAEYCQSSDFFMYCGIFKLLKVYFRCTSQQKIRYMKQIFVPAATLALLMLLTLGACKQQTRDQPTQSKETMDSKTETSTTADNTPTILFFGNSLTAGYGLDPEQSFPSLIEDTLATLGLDYKVINAGLSGETTSGGLNRIDWVLQQPVSIFALELGANDMLRGLPLEETKKNLAAILDKVRTKYPSAKLLLFEMLASPNMGPKYEKDFRQIYQDLAKAPDVTFIPFFLEGVAGNPALLLPDGKHPNADGQKIVAANVWKYLKEVVK